jgi:type II secretory pathway pseudopilin PulG
MAILWVLCAALGRLITLQALLPQARVAYRPLLGLSFLRAGLFLAAVLAGLGALILAGFAGPSGDAAPTVVLAVVIIACIWLVWALLNWLLSVAAVFIARDQQDTFGAIAAAVDLVRSKFGEVVLTTLPFVLLHYLALAVAITSGVLIFDVMTRVSPEAGWALVAIAGGYFAYADFLYMTRLAAYVKLMEPGGEVATRSFPGNLPHLEVSPPSSNMEAPDHCEPEPPVETAEAGIDRA